MKATWHIRLFFLVFCLWGCSGLSPTAAPTDKPRPEFSARPADFTIEYHWSEGSLPPPGHYEYLIRIQSSGEGQVVYWPDYPTFEETPEWTESFSLTPEQLDQLYKIMIANGLFTEAWQAQVAPPVGGSSKRMTITAHGQQIEIPAFVLPEQAAGAKEIFTAVQSIVPQGVWDKLEAQRQEYIEAYSKE